MDKRITNRVSKFPGGASTEKGIQLMRNLIDNQIKVKGYTLDCAAGNNDFKLDISGRAKMMMGIALISTSPDALTNYPTDLEYRVNNEIIVEDLHSFFISPAFMDDSYYFIPRPLSGADDITINLQSPSEQEVYFVIYYI